jgi:hypothetical protein
MKVLKKFSLSRQSGIYIRVCIGCSFKFVLKVGVEEFIVNVPLVSLQSKNTKNAKSEVSGAFTIDSSTPTLTGNLNEHPIHPDIKIN